jgi:hypothetical protein
MDDQQGFSRYLRRLGQHFSIPRRWGLFTLARKSRHTKAPNYSRVCNGIKAEYAHKLLMDQLGR